MTSRILIRNITDLRMRIRKEYFLRIRKMLRTPWLHIAHNHSFGSQHTDNGNLSSLPFSLSCCCKNVVSADEYTNNIVFLTCWWYLTEEVYLPQLWAEDCYFFLKHLSIGIAYKGQQVSEKFFEKNIKTCKLFQWRFLELTKKKKKNLLLFIFFKF